MGDRRSVLRGLLAAAAATLAMQPCALCAGRLPAAAFRRACALGGELSQRAPELLPTTGNARLDAQLLAEHGRAASALGVDPGFGILDDRGLPNALATEDSFAGALAAGSQGTVLLGSELTLQALADNHWGGTVVRAILGHESAHILQFSSDLYDRLKHMQPNDRLLELHADYMAGYYLGLPAQYEPVFIELARDTFYLKGDTAFQSPTHHGSPEARALALTEGFRRGIAGSGVAEAAAAGARFLRAAPA